MNVVYLRFPPRMCSKRAHAASRVSREEQMGLIPERVQEKDERLSFSWGQVLMLSHAPTLRSLSMALSQLSSLQPLVSLEREEDMVGLSSPTSLGSPKH